MDLSPTRAHIPRLHGDRLDGGNVQKRADPKLGRYAVVRHVTSSVGADENVILDNPGHLRVAHLERLATLHHQPKRRERLLFEQLTKVRRSHGIVS